MLTNNEISELLKKYPRQYQAYLKKYHSDTYDFIMSEFPILRDFNFATKVYWHLHELSDFPTYVCPVCGTKIYLNRNVFSVMDGYGRWMNRTGCCYKCSQMNPETREKKCETNLHRFGVEHTSQRKEHKMWCLIAHQRLSRNGGIKRKRKFTSQLFPDMRFDSKWEMTVYEFCKANNLDVIYSPKISLEYEYGGIKHMYHPDFLINGRIYEVKGDQFFRKNEYGMEVMINPYRNPKWTSEEYNYICGRYEAKHQCMKRNNVIILRSKEINNLQEVFNHGNT